jgi:hypothetical protein
MSYIETYLSYPVQRIKTVMTIDADLAPLVRRRPIEILRGIDMRGDWLFGIELRQINSLTLAKLRALAPDGTTVANATCPISEFPDSLEVRHVVQSLGDTEMGALTVRFGEQELELDTVAFKLMEFRSYAPDGRELVAPWMTLALTA